MLSWCPEYLFGHHGKASKQLDMAGQALLICKASEELDLAGGAGTAGLQG